LLPQVATILGWNYKARKRLLARSVPIIPILVSAGQMITLADVRAFRHSPQLQKKPDSMAHPTRFERVAFAFGGQRWDNYPCLPEILWNYFASDVS
jgi:hypothetical protein